MQRGPISIGSFNGCIAKVHGIILYSLFQHSFKKFKGPSFFLYLGKSLSLQTNSSLFFFFSYSLFLEYLSGKFFLKFGEHHYNGSFGKEYSYFSSYYIKTGLFIVI